MTTDSRMHEYTRLLTELHNNYCTDNPHDVLQYCANFFNHKLEQERSLLRDQAQHGTQSRNLDNALERHPLECDDGGLADSAPEDEDEEVENEEDDTVDELFSIPAYNRERRTSVSAESMAPSMATFTKKVIPKTDKQRDAIRLSVENNFLFRNLDDDQRHDVLDAMEIKQVNAGDIVIKQGDPGDFFYVVGLGHFDCFIDKGGARQKVATYEDGGSFGELALMYNAPRAATIIATTNAELWALDRITFRAILMNHTSEKRRMYETLLTEVQLLKSLEQYERHKIADALEQIAFADGDDVVRQGDVGDQFYIIESGEAVVYKADVMGQVTIVNHLAKGSYFGELALLNDSPRAATVRAKGPLKCATLGKKAFTRLLGPVRDILERNSENYSAIISQTPGQDMTH